MSQVMNSKLKTSLKKKNLFQRIEDPTQIVVSKGMLTLRFRRNDMEISARSAEVTVIHV